MLGGLELTLIIIAFVAVLAVIAFLVVRNKKLQANQNQQKEAIMPESVHQTVIKADNTEENDELVAAFMALHLYTSEEVHDEESNVLTIDRIQRRYSPWSSKIYSMNNLQR